MEEQYERIDTKMSRFSVLYQRFSMAQSRENPFFDATRGQGRVVAVLSMQSEISTKDLSYILGIRPASLNELLAKLEKGGYVERFPSPEDGRVKLVRLTEKGKAMNNARQQHSIFECLSDDELASFEKCLDKLNNELSNEVVGEGERMDMKEWFAQAHGRMDEKTFKKMAEARHEMFGDSMPDFGDRETFEKMVEERKRAFGDAAPAGFGSGFGFGFGGYEAAMGKAKDDEN